MGKPLLKKKGKGKPLLKRQPKPEDTTWPKTSPPEEPRKLPPWPKVIGSKKHSVSRPDVIVVTKRPNHPGYPKLNEDRVPPNTFYLVYKKGYALEGLVTVMPRGTRIAWQDCGECHRHVRDCRCGAGVFVPRSVEYIYDGDMAREAGEEWTYNHPNYKGTFRHRQRQTYATSRPRWVSPTPAPRVVGDGPKAQTSKAAESPAERRTDTPARSRKPLRKANGKPKKDTAGKAFSGNTVDRKVADAAASVSAKASTDQLKKALGGKKLLKKKGK